MSADILGAVVDEALCEHPGSEGTDWHPRTADCTCGCGSCVDAARGQPDGATTRPEVTCDSCGHDSSDRHILIYIGGKAQCGVCMAKESL